MFDDHFKLRPERFAHSPNDFSTGLLCALRDRQPPANFLDEFERVGLDRSRRLELCQRPVRAAASSPIRYGTTTPVVMDFERAPASKRIQGAAKQCRVRQMMPKSVSLSCSPMTADHRSPGFMSDEETQGPQPCTTASRYSPSASATFRLPSCPPAPLQLMKTRMLLPETCPTDTSPHAGAPINHAGKPAPRAKGTLRCRSGPKTCEDRCW